MDDSVQDGEKSLISPLKAHNGELIPENKMNTMDKNGRNLEAKEK